MTFKLNDRHLLSGAIVLFYLVPLAALTFYVVDLLPIEKSWSFFSTGLLLTSGGSLGLIVLLYSWERSCKEKSLNMASGASKQLPFPPQNSDETPSTTPKLASFDPFQGSNLLEENGSHDSIDPGQKYELIRLKEELAYKQDTLEQCEKQLEITLSQNERLSQELEDYKLFSDEQLKQKNSQLHSLQKLAEEQRGEMEKRQEQIQALDAKIHDLSYEIKTLLHLDEGENAVSLASPPHTRNSTLPFEPLYPFPVSTVTEDGFSAEQPIKNPLEGAALLLKCIQAAQKLTGGAHYQSTDTSRYRELHPSHYAIDQRRLFDSLRSHTTGLIFVYSLKEQKLLFVNSVCRTLLGWSGEKFLSDFPGMIHEGLAEWKKSLSLFPAVSEHQTRLLVKTKQGSEVLLHCHLGLVTSGIFKNYLISVCYS